MILSGNDSQSFSNIFERGTLSNGLVLDRLSDNNTVSCAATGMTSYSKAILISKGLIDKKETDRIKKGFYTTIETNPKINEGWLYHFTDRFGVAKEYSEVSTIDSALFYLGYLKAAEVLKDEEFLKAVQESIDKINKNIMMKDGYFVHGFNLREGKIDYINYLWDNYDEGLLIYRLFDMKFEPVKTSFSLPLFVYYYPLCFFDDEIYIKNLVNAVEYQKSNFGYIGVTACDGPEGYQAGDITVISPLSVYAASQYSILAQKELIEIEKKFNRLTGSFSTLTDWFSRDMVLIDYASCFLCLRNDSSKSAR